MKVLVACEYSGKVRDAFIRVGHDASKKTCLWLKNLPLLIPTQVIEPKVVGNKKIWGNQTASGQNKLPPSKDRWKIRSETYQGIADAMANQWGKL